MRVQVRKCRITGKIFEEKNLNKYAIHLRELRMHRAEERKLSKVRATFDDWLNCEKKKILTPEDITEWFLANQRAIMDAVNAGASTRREKFYSTDEFTKFSLKTIKFSKLVSNTHVCPDGGVENWGRQDLNKPFGYPGWTANVEGSLRRDKKNMSSYPYGAALNVIGLKTGSGGGGNENWGYGISIFLADWPGLKATVDEMEKDQIVDILKGVTWSRT